MGGNTHKMLRNSLFNFTGYLYPIIFSILITPVIVLTLGPDKFGVFLFINAVSGIMGLLVTGFDGGVIRQITLYNSQNKVDNLKKLAQTMNLVFLFVGFISAALIIGGFFFGKSLGQGSGLYSYTEFFIFFSLVAIHTLITSSGRFYGNIPAGLERFDISAKLNMTNLTLGSIGNLLLVLFGFGLTSLFVWQLIVGVTMLIITFIISRRLLPQISYGLNFHLSELKTILAFSGWGTASEFARTAITSLDKILIPLVAGPAMLTYYSVPANLAGRITSTSGNLSTIIFPTATRLNTEGSPERLQILYIRSSRLIYTISIATGVAIILHSENILRFWLDESFAINSTSVLIIMTFGHILFSMYSTLANFLAGINKMKEVMIYTTIMAITNATMLVLLLPIYGIEGAAWAYLISILPVIALLKVTEKDYLHLNNRMNYYGIFFLKHLSTSTVLYILHLIILDRIVINFFTLAIVGPLTIALYILTFFVFGFFEKEDKYDLITFYKRIITSIKK